MNLLNKFARAITFVKSSKSWIGIFFGCVFLYLALRNADFGKTLSLIKTMSVLPVLAIVSLKVFSFVVRAFRWGVVIEHVKTISPLTLFRALSMGEMGNYLLPARVGELMRVLIISKREWGGGEYLTK